MIISKTHKYNNEFNGWIVKENATPMVLFSANHTLTQGSLHYRLATLSYQKHNTHGVETRIS